jgi:hypothetical protein
MTSKEVAQKILYGSVPADNLMDGIRPLAQAYLNAEAELQCIREMVAGENPIVTDVYRGASGPVAELTRIKNAEAARLQTVVDQHNDTIDALRAELARRPAMDRFAK